MRPNLGRRSTVLHFHHTPLRRCVRVSAAWREIDSGDVVRCLVGLRSKTSLAYCGWLFSTISSRRPSVSATTTSWPAAIRRARQSPTRRSHRAYLALRHWIEPVTRPDNDLYECEREVHDCRPWLVWYG